MTWGQKLTRVSAEAREALAAREFSSEVILTRAREAASQGLNHCLIAPSLPVDVQHTKAVREVIAALSKQQLRFEWAVMPKDLLNENYWMLTVSWGERELAPDQRSRSLSGS